MIRTLLLSAIAWAVASSAHASPTHSLSDITLDPVNGDYHGPEFQHGVNAWTIDILVTLDADDDWTAGGVKAVTQTGSTWYYSDPNLGGLPPFTSAAPQKFDTFVSLPKSQFATARFTSYASLAIAGSYMPVSATAVTTPNEFNVGWIESPPQTTTLDFGAVVRLTLLHTLAAGEIGVYADLSPHDPRDTLLASVEIATGSWHVIGLTISDFAFYASGNHCIGDLTGDGATSLDDLAILLGAYGSCTGDANYLPAADFDHSGCIDLADLSAQLADYGCGP